MASLSVYYKPVITHLCDDTNGRTLCGIVIPNDWECSGHVWTEEDGALCGCARCQRVADKRTKQATREQAREDA